MNTIRINSKTEKKFYKGVYHFTSIGGVEELKNKIESWGHQEFNKKIIKNNIYKNIINGRDIFYRFGESKNILVDSENQNFYDKKMSQIIKNNQKLILKIINKKYNLLNRIFYNSINRLSFKVKEQPKKALKKLVNLFILKFNS